MEESLAIEMPSTNPTENPLVDALKSLESNLEIMEQRIQSDQLVEEHLNQVIKWRLDGNIVWKSLNNTYLNIIELAADAA